MASPTTQIEPTERCGAIDLLIDYDRAAHGPALAYYRALRDRLNRLHAEVGGTGVRLGLATPERDHRDTPTGRISIPVTPLNPADPASAMNALARALLERADPAPGVIRVTLRRDAA